MKLSPVLVSIFSASAAAEVNLVPGSISANSDAGKRLLSKARGLENNNNYNSWIADYSIKFDGCHKIPSFEREEGLRSELLAKFKLCPSNRCGSCPGAGEYFIDAKDFIEAYAEAKREANEYACQTQEETCEAQCQNDDQAQVDDQYDEEGCKYKCLYDAGMSYCDEDDAEGYNIDDIGECRPMNEDQDQNNGYYSSDYKVYYVGAYCTSSGIYAGTFTDSTCSKKAPRGTYEKYNYGYSLPKDALVTTTCMDCKSYGDGDDDGYEISEICEKLYEDAGKCEKKVKGAAYKDTSGCELLHTTLPSLSSSLNKMNSRGPSAATFFAWLFFLGCVVMGAYIFLLHKKVIRTKVDLATLGFGGDAEEKPGVTA